MAQTTYQVRVRDTSGTRIAVFSGSGRAPRLGGLVSFSYAKRVRLPGQWEVRIDGNDERIPLIELDTGLDYLFEFWRRDPLAGLDWYRDFAGFHRSDQDDLGSEGQVIYIARGRGLNDLLAAETVFWPEDSPQAWKNAAAETVAKEFVDENVGPGATVVAGRPRAGNFQGLTVQADGGTGTNWEGRCANENLLDVLRGIAEVAVGDFMLVPNSGANDAIALEFRWKHGQWGLDRTEGNAAGLKPVIFSANLGNTEGISSIYSRLDEVNVVDVGGPSGGAARPYTTRTSGAAGDSPWARRAVFRDGSNEDTATARNAEGDSVLDKQRALRKFSFNTRQTAATRYGRDWGLGDLVSVERRDATRTQKVSGVRVTLSANGTITTEPELEDL